MTAPASFSARLHLLKLDAALNDPVLDRCELVNLQPLRDEVARRVRGDGVRVGESPQRVLGLGVRGV